MEIFELVIALLSTIPEGIKGRTVVQKLGYFASVELEMDAGYAADFYGPFSSAVALNLQNMTELDFVFERGRQTLRNRTMYNYSLTEDGLKLAQKVKEEYPREHTIIDDIIRKCRETTHCNYNVLSWAAKVHFVLTHARRAMTRAEAIDASQSFGWKLNHEEVESAVRLLLALGLINEE